MKPTLQDFAFGSCYGRARMRLGIALYLAVLVFGAIPGVRAELGIVAPGIVLHTVTYSLITFLLYSACVPGSLPNAAKIFVLVLIMGAVDELIQMLLPYRRGAILDWLVDTNACLITLFVMQGNWFIRRQQAAAGKERR